MKNNIIFIAGIPACGKTTISRELALRIKADKVIDLDCLKNTCKIFIGKEEEPYLYTTSHEAYKLENLSMFEGYKKYCEVIQTYLIELLGKLGDEKTIIVEGAQLTPDVMKKLDGDYNCIYFNLLANEVDFKSRVKEKLENRKGKWLEHMSVLFELQQSLKDLPNQINIENIEKEETLSKIIEVLRNENICSQ